jgi:hypothetical protein
MLLLKIIRERWRSGACTISQGKLAGLIVPCEPEPLNETTLVGSAPEALALGAPTTSIAATTATPISDFCMLSSFRVLLISAAVRWLFHLGNSGIEIKEPDNSPEGNRSLPHSAQPGRVSFVEHHD